MHISASAATPRRADRIGVELHELAEAARARLLVAEHAARAIAAIGLRQLVEIFRDMAGQRRGQVVAQRHPLLVVVLQRKHALVRAVLVGQELAERVGIFDQRRLDRIEAVALDRPRGSRHHRRWRGCRRTVASLVGAETFPLLVRHGPAVHLVAGGSVGNRTKKRRDGRGRLTVARHVQPTAAGPRAGSGSPAGSSGTSPAPARPPGPCCSSDRSRAARRTTRPASRRASAS